MAYEHGQFRVYVVEVCTALRLEPPDDVLRARRRHAAPPAQEAADLLD